MKLADIEVGKSYIDYTLVGWTIHKILSKKERKIRYDSFRILHQTNEPIRTLEISNSVNVPDAGINFHTVTSAKKHFAFQLIFR